MPFRDGSGPNGSGPLTGRGMGNCNPDQDYVDDYGYRGRSFGRGRGFGRGMGRGFGGMRNGYRRGYGFDNYDEGPAYHNKSYLESVVSYLSDKLNSYKKRLEELEDK